MRSSLPFRTVLGIDIAAVTKAQALAEVEALLAARQPALIAYANAHSCNIAFTHRAYRGVLADSALVLPDGSGLAIAAKIQRTAFPENLNGTDFTPALLERAGELGKSVYLLGGKPGIAERAAAELQFPGLRIVGACDGFSADHEAVVAEIRASGADILVVGMGNPRQELWLSRHLSDTGAVLGIAAGAFLDFTAGEVRRAPEWMRRIGIEWIFRLIGEPKRLFIRYVLGNPLFLARVLRERLRR